jgi:magnesium chelatase family protein
VLKNKKTIGNNGFSQAVVPRKRPVDKTQKQKAKKTNPLDTTPSSGFLFPLLLATVLPWPTIRRTMARIIGVIESGLEGTLVDVECTLANSLPNIVIVGYANRSVDEARERLRSAFASSKLPLPRKRIVINLAPADIPKDGTGFDLPMAVAILAAKGALPADRSDEPVIFAGELGLDGSVRPIRGIIGVCLAAQSLGISTLVLPEQNLGQAALVPGMTLIPVGSLSQLFAHLTGSEPIAPVLSGEGTFRHSVRPPVTIDFNEIAGQASAKRALEIAVAGGHNVLLSGPPGTGKSMLARAAASIMPPLTQAEALIITHLHSLASRSYDRIVTERPFRSPHHSASDASLVGGGPSPKPGEISLAHGGILFLDEFPEFRRSAIEILRQPLEDRSITISRARGSVRYPAEFILIATRNPCPCGFYGSTRPCVCTLAEAGRYDKKLSGPVIDRIDLYVDVEPVEHARLLKPDDSVASSHDIAARVAAARGLQAARASNLGRLNGSLDNRAVKSLARLDDGAMELLNQAAGRLHISARGYMRAVKVSRTIADLDGSETILSRHLAEALQYRPKHTARTQAVAT